MNLQELFERAIEGEPEARVRNTKTAVRVYAKALGYDSPTTCPQEAYNQPLSQVYRLLDRQLQGKGPHTIRNAKNYLSRLFRSAADQGLLSLMPSRLTTQLSTKDFRKRKGRKSATYKADGTHFRFAAWTPRLRGEWEQFYHWCTAPLVDGREAAQRKRPVTTRVYLIHFESFFGYLLRERHIPAEDLCFDHLFTFPLVRDYAHWQVNVKHRRVTRSIHSFFCCLKALAHTYRPDADFHREVSQFFRSLPRPAPFLNKEEVWLPLVMIEQIARALWPTKLPRDMISGGSQAAKCAGLSLMLHLWCRIPLRQRNMREMELGKNLFQDTQGKWMIRFAEEELKVAKRNGAPNVFELPFPEHLVPLLEQYLNVWRPVLLKRRGAPTHLVFLNRDGRAYEYTVLTNLVRLTMYRYTGKAFHPHLIRTIWATEYIKKTGDIYRAAVMLNDRLETVVKNYSHLSQQGVAEHAYRVIQDILDPNPFSPSHIARKSDDVTRDIISRGPTDPAPSPPQKTST